MTHPSPRFGAEAPTLFPTTWADTRAHWRASDWVALASVPAIFIIVGSSASILGVGWPAIIIDTSLRIGLCLVLLIMYRRVLAEHWRRFSERFWLNAGLVVAGAILMQVVITLVRLVVQNPGSGAAETAPIADPMTAQGGELALMFFATLGPLAIVLIEESVFRHTLLVKVPIWGSKPLAVIGILLNGAVFGAIHYSNFGSLLGTVPYMVVGVLFNLVYLWRGNLWHVLLMHFLNNLVLTTGGLALVVAVRGLVQ